MLPAALATLQAKDLQRLLRHVSSQPSHFGCQNPPMYYETLPTMMDVVRAEKEKDSGSTEEARYVPDRNEVPLATAACRAKSAKTGTAWHQHMLRKNVLEQAAGHRSAQNTALLAELHLARAVSRSSSQATAFTCCSPRSRCFARSIGHETQNTLRCSSYPCPSPFRGLLAAALRCIGEARMVGASSGSAGSAVSFVGVCGMAQHCGASKLKARGDSKFQEQNHSMLLSLKDSRRRSRL